MNTACRLLPRLSALLFLVAGGFLNPLSAQDADPSGKSALTYDRYPYSFDSSNPLKPESPVLLRGGRIVGEGNAADMADRDALAAAYFGGSGTGMEAAT